METTNQPLFQHRMPRWVVIVAYVVMLWFTPTLTIAEEESISVNAPSLNGLERPIPLEVPVGNITEVSGFAQYLSVLYQFIIASIAILSAVMLMFNGMRWATAGGNSEMVGVAKGGVTNAIIGLLIALFSFVLLNVINPDLVNFEELNIPGITVAEPPAIQSSYKYVINGCSLDNATLSGGGFNQAVPPVRVCSSGNVIEDLGQILSRSQVADAINASRGDISPIFILAIMKAESNYCSNAFSSANACGVTQTLIGTARAFSSQCGINLSEVNATACNQIINNPYKAICMGAGFLNSVNDSPYKREGEEDLAAGYNGGTCGKTQRGSWNGALCESKSCQGQKFWECEANEGYNETRNYVVKVGRFKDELCRAMGGTVIEREERNVVAETDGACADPTDTDDPDCLATEEAPDGSCEDPENPDDPDCLATEEADNCADVEDVDDPECTPVEE